MTQIDRKQTIPPLSAPTRAALIMAPRVENGPKWDSTVNMNDLSIKVSSKILELFKKDYSHNEEDFYILLANKKTGVIEKACDKFAHRGKDSAGTERGFFEYLNKIADKEGYFVVGYYHSHPSARTTSLAGDLLSGDDIYGHDKLKNDVLRFLGNGVGKVPFETRAFVPLNTYLLGEQHPLISRKKEFEEKGLLAKSRYDGYVNKNLLVLKIIPEETKVSIDADDILSKNPPFMHLEQRDLDNIKALSLRETVLGPTDIKDKFPFVGPITKSSIETKLRHDGEFSISFMMHAPRWNGNDYDNHRYFRIHFTADGKHDIFNSEKFDIRKIRADIAELLKEKKFPTNIQEKFAKLMDNYQTNFPLPSDK